MSKIIATFAVIIIVIGIWFVARPASNSGARQTAAVPQATSAPQGQSLGASTTKTYTMSDVSKHNSESSCWTAINGKVYDLTNWINQHPGGPSRILSICGSDGSGAFNQKHGDESKPNAMLQSFFIGDLSTK